MIRPSVTICVVLIALCGCGAGSTFQAESVATVRLYVFDCGRLRFAALEWFSISADETDVRELAVPCYLIEHDRGRLLWDGGLASRTAEVEGWHGEGTLMRLDLTLAEQLAEIGLGMSSFDYMAYSHMHFDHVGVASEVEGATLIIQRAEYDAAFADDPKVPGLEPSLYAKLKDADKVFLEGDHDVFGDGRVRIISAPGHTPGHQVLFVDLTRTGPILLSGDLYHFAISRREKRVPTFNVDAEVTLASMEKVENLVEETGATMWIQHELALFEQLERSPAYYD